MEKNLSKESKYNLTQMILKIKVKQFKQLRNAQRELFKSQVKLIEIYQNLNAILIHQTLVIFLTTKKLTVLTISKSSTKRESKELRKQEQLKLYF